MSKRGLNQMSNVMTQYIVVSDDAPEEAIREAVRIKAKMLEADVNMNDIKVVRQSELRQPSLPDTNQASEEPMSNEPSKYLSTITAEYVQNVYVALDGTLRPHKFPRSGLWYFDGQVFYQKLEFFESQKGKL